MSSTGRGARRFARAFARPACGKLRLGKVGFAIGELRARCRKLGSQALEFRAVTAVARGARFGARFGQRSLRSLEPNLRFLENAA